MSNKEIIEFLNALKIFKSKYEIYLKNHHENVLQEIYEKTNFLDKAYSRKITFAERLYCIENNITKPVICPVCNKNFLNFRTDIRQYRLNCSNKCSKSSKTTIEKRAETKLKLYGNSGYCNPEKSKISRQKHYNGKYAPPDFKQKRKATLKEKYGNENYNNVEKYRQTCLKKYGAEHPMMDVAFKKKYFENIKEKYNVNSVFQLSSVREKTNYGIRYRAWKYLTQRLQNIELLTSKEDFFKIENLNSDTALRLKCKVCGTEYESYWDDGCAKQCPTCFPKLHGTSNQEKEVFEFLNSLKENKFRQNCKDIISPKEIDIFCDENKLAIEYDGLYWHSDACNSNNMLHLNKTLECEKQGIQLIHIFENEWLTKQNIVKSRLKNLLGIYDKTIFARKCQIKEIDSKTSKEFQEENHIQGSVNSKVNLGLYYNKELISLMTFGKCRFDNKHEWELLRFCNKLGYHIPGGASKLLKYFERNYNPKSLVSYADRRWSQGKVYEKLGFTFSHASSPNYWYLCINNTTKLYSRVKYQKYKLKTLLENFDENKSEVENMRDNGYHRIFDCGNLVYEKLY